MGGLPATACRGKEGPWEGPHEFRASGTTPSYHAQGQRITGPPLIARAMRPGAGQGPQEPRHTWSKAAETVAAASPVGLALVLPGCPGRCDVPDSQPREPSSCVPISWDGSPLGYDPNDRGGQTNTQSTAPHQNPHPYLPRSTAGGRCKPSEIWNGFWITCEKKGRSCNAWVAPCSGPPEHRATCKGCTAGPYSNQHRIRLRW